MKITLDWQQYTLNAEEFGAFVKCLDICIEIRKAFDYFSEWDLPIGFEDRLNAALAACGYERKEE